MNPPESAKPEVISGWVAFPSEVSRMKALESDAPVSSGSMVEPVSPPARVSRVKPANFHVPTWACRHRARIENESIGFSQSGLRFIHDKGNH